MFSSVLLNVCNGTIIKKKCCCFLDQELSWHCKCSYFYLFLYVLGRRKVHYTFPDEAEMVEEYDVSSGELLGQKTRNKLVLLAFTGLLVLNYSAMTFLNICTYINKLQNR